MIDTLILYGTSASAVYLLTMALVTHTKNPQSALVFKVLPFVIGGLNAIVALKLWGVL